MAEDFQPLTKRARIGWTLSLMSGSLTLYLLVGWLQPGGVAPTMVSTAVDDWVPFSLWWLPMYLVMLPMSWAAPCALADRRCVKRWVVSVLLMYVVATPLWLFWPVTVPREPVEVEGYWTFMLWFLRAVDPPVNCLPSMHVAVATMAGLLIRRVDPTVGRLLLWCMPFIWYSTMALDQHWFVDGLVGMVLAVVVEGLTNRWMPVPGSALVAMDRRTHWAWLGPFLAALVGIWVYWVGWV